MQRTVLGRQGRAIVQAVSSGPLAAGARVRARASLCEICRLVDKAARVQVSSEFFGFPLSISFHRRYPYSYRPAGGRSSET
jgi:hypothetical protein